MASCSACPAAAAVQWSRRPTADEVAVLVAADSDWRYGVLLNADPELPPPVFGDVPAVTNTVVAVYGCPAHGIALELASFVHQSTCTAPNTANLPGCDCVPEPLVQPPAVQSDATALPAGW